MTRKDYERLAAALAMARRHMLDALARDEACDAVTVTPGSVFDLCVACVAAACKSENPRFDYDRFRQQIGLVLRLYDND